MIRREKCYFSKYKKALYKLHEKQYNKIKLLLNNSIKFRIKIFIDTKRFVSNLNLLVIEMAPFFELLSNDSHQSYFDVFKKMGSEYDGYDMMRHDLFCN